MTRTGSPSTGCWGWAATSRSSSSGRWPAGSRSEEHTSELQSQSNLVCRLLLEKKSTRRRAAAAGRATLRRRGSRGATRASPGSREQRDRLDLGQLERERLPEPAAVAGDVEPVPRREEDEVGILVADRDRPAGRKPRAGLAPRPPGVVRDGEGRAAVDDGDHRRARARGGDDEREAGLDLRDVERRTLVELEHELLLEVDGVDTVLGLDCGPHSSARTWATTLL